MATSTKTLRTCKRGHQYYKSSDCPVCLVCTSEQKTNDDFLSSLRAPAHRALQGKGLTTVRELAGYTAAEIKKFHGMGVCYPAEATQSRGFSRLDL